MAGRLAAFLLTTIRRTTSAAIFCLVQIGAAAAQTGDAATVPFVGCPLRDYASPAPPEASGPTPAVPAAVATRLAYYYAQGIAVLAPRGWHCQALLGSGGTFLFVAPDSHEVEDIVHPETELRGPAIELASNFGGASGRFVVAMVAARIFPVDKDFVQGVIDEGIVPKEEFAFAPYPDDQLTRLSDTEVEFVTPANREGLGTNSRLEKNDQPIKGVAILFPYPNAETDLVMLTVRLPPEMDDLSSTIVKNVEMYQGRSIGAPQP